MAQQPAPAFAIFDDYRPTVAIAVVIRWILLASWLVLNNYRVEQDPTNLVLNLWGAGLALLNGYMTWRIIARRPITWRHALALSLADLAVITGGLVLRGGLQNPFYIFYYPALLGFSLMFPRRAGFGIAALVGGLYILIAFTVEPTLSLEQADEKSLAVRLVNMVGIVAAGALITGWERRRRREAVEAERLRFEENLSLQRRAQEAELAAAEERGRIAREIHDGVAQSLYMLNLSLEACVALASREQNGLEERLQSLVKLSKQALLETRHYIFDLKPLLDGNRSVVRMLEHQVEEFGAITSVPATLTVIGHERPLPLVGSAGLYRIMQEGLANVYKHAQATRVEARLAFEEGRVILEICDDGQGFRVDDGPVGYGLDSMSRRAGEMGGRLEVESAPGRGACVRLTIPITMESLADRPAPK